MPIQIPRAGVNTMIEKFTADEMADMVKLAAKLSSIAADLPGTNTHPLHKPLTTASALLRRMYVYAYYAERQRVRFMILKANLDAMTDIVAEILQNKK